MQLDQFIFQLATGIVDELRRTPEGQALHQLLKPRRPHRATKRNVNPRPRQPDVNPDPPPPPPAETPRPAQTVDLARAALVLAQFSTISPILILEDDNARRQAFREAAKRTHPDKGGSADQFQQVTWAKEVLSIV